MTKSGRTDWFIGETRFVIAGPPKKDVVIQVWCINVAPTATQENGKTEWTAHDYYSVRVLTSFDDEKGEVVALPAGLHICPFFYGKNLATAFGKPMVTLSGDELKDLPGQIDWISNNGDIAKRGDNAFRKDDLAEKTIIWIFPKNIRKDSSEGAVVAGKIIVKAGATDPKKESDVPADAFPPDQPHQPPNMYSVPSGAAPVPASKLTGAEKLTLYKEAVAEYEANKNTKRRALGAGLPTIGSVQDAALPGGPAGPTVPHAAPVVVSNVGTGSGVTADSSGFEYYCYTACTASLPAGRKITLYAEPFAGSVFARWSGACSGTRPVCQFTARAGDRVLAGYIRLHWRLRS